MVTAFVLINIEGAKASEIAERLRGLDGIAEVHLVAGEYDILAVARVESNAALSNLITRQLVHTGGILRTKTLISMEECGGGAAQ